MKLSQESSNKRYIDVELCKHNIEKSLFLKKYTILKLLKRDSLYSVGLKSLEAEAPISFVGFWGANHKNTMDQNDITVLNRIKALASHIQSSWTTGCCWNVILCDMHAIRNGFEEEGVRSYLKEIEAVLQEHKAFKVIYLSRLWKEHKLEEKISEALKDVSAKWDKLDIAGLIEQQAERHDHSKRRVVNSAQEYYAMRWVEARCLEKLYRDGVFFTFSTDRLQELYPDMPTLYLWSLKRGTCNPPWLLFDAGGRKDKNG